jgi:hypothetical protein
MSSISETNNKTYVDLVRECDNFKVSENINNLTLYCLDETSLRAPVGLMWPEVVSALKETEEGRKKAKQSSFWAFIEHDKRVTHVHFHEDCITPEQRTDALIQTTTMWRDGGKFEAIVGPKKWREELYPIYRDPYQEPSTEAIACEVPRAAAALFGIVTRGVHLIVYQRPRDDGPWMIWVSERSKSRPTCVNPSLSGSRNPC